MLATFNASARSTGHGEAVTTSITFRGNKPPDWESGVYFFTGSAPSRQLWRDNAGNAADAFIATETLAQTSLVAPGGAEWVTAGEETMGRHGLAHDSVQPGTGIIRLSYFTARRTERVGSIKVTLANAAGVSVTTGLLGVFDVTDPTLGTLANTPAATTTNDTTSWGTTQAAVTKTLVAPWDKVAGNRYAFAVFFVAATTPGLVGVNGTTGANVIANEDPVRARLVSGQSGTTFPANAASYTLGGSTQFFRGVLIPV